MQMPATSCSLGRQAHAKPSGLEASGRQLRGPHGDASQTSTRSAHVEPAGRETTGCVTCASLCVSWFLLDALLRQKERGDAASAVRFDNPGNERKALIIQVHMTPKCKVRTFAFIPQEGSMRHGGRFVAIRCVKRCDVRHGISTWTICVVFTCVVESSFFLTMVLQRQICFGAQ